MKASMTEAQADKRAGWSGAAAELRPGNVQTETIMSALFSPPKTPELPPPPSAPTRDDAADAVAAAEEARRRRAAAGRSSTVLNTEEGIPGETVGKKSLLG